MTHPSRYLRHLPPVLQTETDRNRLPLGDLLGVFEKILTGIDDGEHLLHRPPGKSEAHERQAVEQVIAALYHLFQPWSVREDFLPWLASWVALEFPTLGDKLLWDEYQQRRAVADMTDVYRQRGLKAGLRHSLYLHTLGDGHPRIAIDDGTKIHFCQPKPDHLAPVHTLISWGAWRETGTIKADGLIRPWRLTCLPDGDLIVGDLGLKFKNEQIIEPRLWRISAADRTSAEIAAGKITDLAPVSICVAPESGDLYVLNGQVATKLYKIAKSGSSGSSGSYEEAENIPLPDSGPDKLVSPVAMVARRDESVLHLFILDRGNGDYLLDADPKIVEVTPDAAVPFASHKVTGVVEPLSLALLSNGNFIIGDGELQNPPGSQSGKLVLVDGTSWHATPFAPESAQDNILVAPIALVPVEDDHFYVLDVGLRPWKTSGGEVFLSKVARDATIYSVSREGEKNTITIKPASEAGQMVYPSGMALRDGTLFVADPGFDYSGDEERSLWRLRRHEFATIVHFLEAAVPTDKTKSAFLNRVLRTIRTTVQRDKPAHALFTLFPEVGSFVEDQDR